MPQSSAPDITGELTALPHTRTTPHLARALTPISPSPMCRKPIIASESLLLSLTNSRHHTVPVVSETRDAFNLSRFCDTIQYDRWFALENWRASCEFS